MNSPFQEYDPTHRSGVQDDPSKLKTEPAKPKFRMPTVRRKPLLVITVIAAALVAIVVYLWPSTVPNVPTAERTIPVSTATPTPDLRTRVNEAYGPWHVVNQASDAPKSILLVSEYGGLRAGRELTGIPQSSWKPASNPYITDKTLDMSKKTVTFRLNGSTIATVLANQPFVIERSLENIYKFNDQGTLVATPIGV